MTQTQPKFRPKVFLMAVAGGSVLLLAGSAVASIAWHHYQVANHDGNWCIRFHPDGKQQTLYGAEACNFPKEDEQNP
ncbi:hypothetical protein QQ056_17930 [Oscillatoria laete-virens NRMC-F 0139]|nr:hypothetical protein [Oscillatoria laete-virens]MDL5055412.1 hypothetical protein [Oscillatoria laete-virens NRMC-F 0139]